jgi:hypothetical protein
MLVYYTSNYKKIVGGVIIITSKRVYYSLKLSANYIVACYTNVVV